MPNNIELSVVILCYKSGKKIIPFANKAKDIISNITKSFEIILVINYFDIQSDETINYVEQLSQSDSVFKMISKPKKGMMGWDVKSGLEAANGKFLCFIDGDGQFPLESIGTCYSHIRNGQYGLVKTYRSKRNDGFKREFISILYNLIFSLLFPRVSAKDINSKPKMFHREVYELLNLEYDDWFIDAEIMIKIARLKINFFEFPVEFLSLEDRKSFVNMRTVFEFMKNLFIFRLRGDKG